uniref:Uncharacterized protein n=1 Tax=Anguilla anguilla TaxID=7936 RepID=A0A0E9SAW7_ANGAN
MRISLQPHAHCLTANQNLWSIATHQAKLCLHPKHNGEHCRCMI